MCRCRCASSGSSVWKNTREPSLRLARVDRIERAVAAERPGRDQGRGAARALVHVPPSRPCRPPRATRRCRRRPPSRPGRSPPKITWNGPLPPAGPVDISVVVPLKRSYRSCVVSVSPDTSCSEVRKNTRVPSARVRGERGAEGAVASRGAGGQQRRRGARPLVDVHPRVGVRRDQGSLLWKKTRRPVRRGAPELAADGAVPPGGPGGDDRGRVVVAPSRRAHKRARSRTQRPPLLPSSIHPQSQRRPCSCLY